MKPELQKLLDRLINDDGRKNITREELDFLESIQSLDDIKPQSNEQLQALAYDAARALGATSEDAEIRIGERQIAAIPDVAVPDKPIPDEYKVQIHLHYYDGEYLSGYILHGEEAKLLEKLGLAKYVSGWGYHVNDEIVKRLGTDFSGADAWKLAQPAIEARERKQAEAEAARKTIFDIARRTGQKQVLDNYTDECNDPREECSLDSVTVYAMPDGSTKTVRSHTW